MGGGRADGERAGRRRRSRPRAGTDDGDHPGIRGSAEPLPHDSEPSLSCLELPARVHDRIGLARGFLGDAANLGRDLHHLPERSCGVRLPRDLSDGPDEAGELTRYRRDRLRLADAAGEVPVAVVEPPLCLPGSVDHLGRHALVAPAKFRAHLRWPPRMLSSLAEDMAQQSVPGLGDVTAMTGGAARVFAREPGPRTT